MIISTGLMPNIDQLSDRFLKEKNSQIGTSKQETKSFSEILSQKKEAASATELRFSKHALLRLDSRNISLTQEQIDRLEDGKQKAMAKGINESLVLVDNLAFIVNIKNNTVVTAMDSTKADESIYTNIDGAVIA